MIAHILVLALAFAAPPPDGESEQFKKAWAKHSATFEAEGISRPMANHAYLWVEGQYYLGLCSPFLKKADIEFWRYWWRKTPLGNGPLGREILKEGEQGFIDGIADIKRKPLDATQCQRVADSWIADMKKASDRPVTTPKAAERG